MYRRDVTPYVLYVAYLEDSVWQQIHSEYLSGDTTEKTVQNFSSCTRYVFVCYVHKQSRGRPGCTKKYVREQDIQEAVSRSLRLQVEAVLDLERRIKRGGVIRMQEKGLDGRPREGVRAQLERMKELCKERNNLYEKQNDLKGQKQKIEKLSER